LLKLQSLTNLISDLITEEKSSEESSLVTEEESSTSPSLFPVSPFFSAGGNGFSLGTIFFCPHEKIKQQIKTIDKYLITILLPLFTILQLLTRIISSNRNLFVNYFQAPSLSPCKKSSCSFIISPNNNPHIKRACDNT
jgi:hypothetical protein